MRGAFVAAAGLFLGGVLAATAWSGPGVAAAGLGMMSLSIWLLKYDIARRTVRQSGLPRYIAACLLSGYGWLGAAGALLVTHGLPAAGPIYDAALHMVFVGFTFSMIFGHAPVIFPAVAGVRLTHHARGYVPWALLHLSMVMRVVGDLEPDALLRQAGAMLNAIAIVLFLAGTAASISRDGSKRRG